METKKEADEKERKAIAAMVTMLRDAFPRAWTVVSLHGAHPLAITHLDSLVEAKTLMRLQPTLTLAGRERKQMIPDRDVVCWWPSITLGTSTTVFEPRSPTANWVPIYVRETKSWSCKANPALQLELVEVARRLHAEASAVLVQRMKSRDVFDACLETHDAFAQAQRVWRMLDIDVAKFTNIAGDRHISRAIRKPKPVVVRKKPLTSITNRHLVGTGLAFLDAMTTATKDTVSAPSAAVAPDAPSPPPPQPAHWAVSELL